MVKEFYFSIALGRYELINPEEFVEDGLKVFLSGKEFAIIAKDFRKLLKTKYKVGELKVPKTYDPSPM